MSVILCCYSFLGRQLCWFLWFWGKMCSAPGSRAGSWELGGVRSQHSIAPAAHQPVLLNTWACTLGTWWPRSRLLILHVVSHLCYFLSCEKTKMSNEGQDQSCKALEELWVNHMDVLQIWGKHSQVTRALQRSCREGASPFGKLKWTQSPRVGKEGNFFPGLVHCLSCAGMLTRGAWSCGVYGLLSRVFSPTGASAAGVT